MHMLNNLTVIMHAVDQVFSQQDADMVQCKEAISEKKLNKKDGGWSQQKEILDWLPDSNHSTLELTLCCSKCIVLDIFEGLCGWTRAGIKNWQ